MEDRPVYSKSTCFETFPFPDESTGLTSELRQKIASLAEQIDAPTREFGVRAVALRSVKHMELAAGGAVGGFGSRFGERSEYEAPAVTGCPTCGRHTSQQTSRQGLVGVLKDLHDELDTAVLQAYGLSATASVEDILSHLVTLNQQRAAEEAHGVVRWLRLEFENPVKSTADSLSKQELLTQTQQALKSFFP